MMGSGPVRSLSAETSRRVVAGQSLLDAAAVVKELVENALDAAADKVEVRLRGHAGATAIQVADNGSGLLDQTPQGLAALLARSSTSKLRAFDPVRDGTVHTFGFRGEALALIAELSAAVQVTTAAVGQDVGLDVRYDFAGNVTRSGPSPRTQGTTVIVHRLFERYPVRRQEAASHAKRDLARVIFTMQSFALANTTTRFSLHSDTAALLLTRPVSPTLLSTSETKALQAAAAAILGSKLTSSLRPLVTELDDFPGWSVCALIGGGRSSGDRHFFSLRGRIVEFPKLARALTNAHRRAQTPPSATVVSPTTYPILIMTIHCPPGAVEHNSAPDKRALLLHRETEIVNAIVSAAEAADVWSPVPTDPGTHVKQAKPDQQSFVLPVQRALEAGPDGGLLTSAKTAAEKYRQQHSDHVVSTRGNSDHDPKTNADRTNAAKSNGSDVDSTSAIEIYENTTRFDRVGNSQKPTLPGNPSWASQKTTQQLPHVLGVKQLAPKKNNSSIGPMTNTVDKTSTAPNPHVLQESQSGSQVTPQPSSHVLQARQRLVEMTNKTSRPARKSITDFLVSKRRRVAPPSSSDQSEVQPVSGTDDISRSRGMEMSPTSLAAMDDNKQQRNDTPNAEVALDTRLDSPKRARPRPRTVVEYNADSVTSFWKSSGNSGSQLSYDSRTGQYITEDIEDPEAEGELVRIFQKKWFGKMSIVAQFNLGFIVCQLGRDLFIVDQHAADEKFNFEDLQGKNSLRVQRLLQPMALELSAEEECLVIDNAAAFKAGGFEFQIDQAAEPTQRVSLTTIPYTKNVLFGISDVQEILSKLREAAQNGQKAPKVLVPERVRAINASRACRKSVMIGTALEFGKLEELVRNLQGLDHPWQCPHGRPTMRHLYTMDKA